MVGSRAAETGEVDHRNLWGPVWLAPALIALVYLAAGTWRLTQGWQPSGDWAVAELVVRHAGRSVPLSGPFSLQRGYDHPSPLVYLFEWIPYRLSDERSVSVAAATVWANGALLAVLVWLLARRRALVLGLLAATGLALTAARSSDGVLLMPWNPNLAIVPALMLVFVAWRVACGEGRLLPLAAALAVWVAGAHLVFVPFAAVVSSFAATGLLVKARQASGLRALARPAAMAAVVALVMLTPLLVDVVSHGSEEAVKVLSAELAVPPTWAAARPAYRTISQDPAIQPPFQLLAGGAVAWAAWRRRAVDELLGLGASAAGLFGGFLVLLRLDDVSLRPWYVYPSHVSGAAFAAFACWSGARSLLDALAPRERPPPWAVPSPATAAVAVVAVAVAAVAGSMLAVPSLHTIPILDTSARSVTPLVRAAKRRYPEGSHLLVLGPSPFDDFYFAALVLQLDRAGLDVRVADDELYKFKSAMVVPDRWRGTTLVLGLAGAHSPPLPGARLVADTDVQAILFDIPNLSLWQARRSRA